MSDGIPVLSFERLRAETYTDVVAAPLFLYDYLLTFDLVLALIWPSEWSFVKVLFMLTRYLPFVDVTLVMFYEMNTNISPETCKRAYTPAGWLIVLGIIIAEIILVVRTWAVWGRGKRIGYVLLVACIVGVVPVLVIEHIFLSSTIFSPHPARATPGCLLTSANPIIAISFIVVIVFETFVLVLTLVKGFQLYRTTGGGGIIAVLYRDGLIFYCYLFGVSLVNLVDILTAPPDISSNLAILQRVMHSCLSARVLLNLRQARKDETEGSAGFGLTSLRRISFFRPQVSGDTETSSRSILHDRVIDASTTLVNGSSM